jgi:hypothetical protein
LLAGLFRINFPGFIFPTDVIAFLIEEMVLVYLPKNIGCKNFFAMRNYNLLNTLRAWSPYNLKANITMVGVFYHGKWDAKALNLPKMNTMHF